MCVVIDVSNRSVTVYMFWQKARCNWPCMIEGTGIAESHPLKCSLSTYEVSLSQFSHTFPQSPLHVHFFPYTYPSPTVKVNKIAYIAFRSCEFFWGLSTFASSLTGGVSVAEHQPQLVNGRGYVMGWKLAGRSRSSKGSADRIYIVTSVTIHMIIHIRGRSDLGWGVDFGVWGRLGVGWLMISSLS